MPHPFTRRIVMKQLATAGLFATAGAACSRTKDSLDRPEPIGVALASLVPGKIFMAPPESVVFQDSANIKKVTLPLHTSAIGRVEYQISVEDPTSLSAEVVRDELFVMPASTDVAWTTVTITGTADGMSETVSLKVHFNQRMQTNPEPISVYTDRMSYMPGDSISVCVSGKEAFDLDIVRLDRGAQVVRSERRVRCTPQKYRLCASSIGANWPSSILVKVDESWESGMYGVRATAGAHTRTFPIVIRSTPERQGPVVFLASTNTWNAYNSWGGASGYLYRVKDGTGKQREAVLSLRRPTTVLFDNPADHLVGGEIQLLNWLASKDIKASVVCDSDLHFDDVLSSAKVLVMGPHPEYWSEAMRDKLNRFLDSGGSLAYLGGNGLYTRTEMNDVGQMEVVDTGARHTFTNRPGGYWRDLGRPEQQTLGVQYDATGYDTYAPFEVRAACHWLFDGCDVEPGTLIGVGNGYRDASGWEMDRQGPHTPAGAVLLAKGQNAKDSGAEMTFYEHTGGGGVFAAGSLTFARAMVSDPILATVVQNFFRRFVT